MLLVLVGTLTCTHCLRYMRNMTLIRTCQVTTMLGRTSWRLRPTTLFDYLMGGLDVLVHHDLRTHGAMKFLRKFRPTRNDFAWVETHHLKMISEKECLQLLPLVDLTQYNPSFKFTHKVSAKIQQEYQHLARTLSDARSCFKPTLSNLPPESGVGLLVGI